MDFQDKFTLSERSWFVNAKNVDCSSFDLGVRNPSKIDETALREPSDILAEIRNLELRNEQILAEIEELL